MLLTLSAFPFPAGSLGTVRPVFILIAVYYWSVTRPDMLPFIAAFFTGLIFDLVCGYPTDMTALTQKLAPQIREASLTVLSTLAGFGVGLIMFIVALILAGVIMAYGENGSRSAVQIASRIFGPDRGDHIAALCTATIRAVAQISSALA